MSALQRSAMNARIAKLPQLPPSISPSVAPYSTREENDGEEEEETDDLGALPSKATTSNKSNRSLRCSKPDDAEFAPISAASYFSQAVEVAVPSAKHTFRVYYTPPKISGSKGTVMICHHGAGFSALSFACFAKEVESLSQGECGVLALDAREHGKTSSTDSTEAMDLSIERLQTDLVELIKTIFPTPSESPTLLLVGHSMGGSVIVRASSPLLAAKYKIAGVAVLDVVEGFTLEALPHMHNLLDSRPNEFATLEDAIRWHPLESRSLLSSFHLARDGSGELLYAQLLHTGLVSPSGPSSTIDRSIPLFLDWFTGLSSMFLSSRTARLLVLAGTDRLDRELMIGQMQGKFQMVVVPHVGHMVHEDDPARLAEILVEFWKRNDRVVFGVKKVGET